MLETWPASVNYITQDNNDSMFTFGSIDLKFYK